MPKGVVILKRDSILAMVLAGAGAGLVTGLLGAGGGMVLVPLLTLLTNLDGQQVFAASLAVILPVCLVSLAITWLQGGLPWQQAVVLLPGSALGGLAAGLWGKKIPATALHRGLGLLILWGGVRNLWF